MSDKDRPEVVSFPLCIDTELKRQFEQFCDDVGISMTATFTLSAKKGCQGTSHSLLEIFMRF